MKIDKNFVLFVTGACSGLGRASATYFLKKGCKVAVTDVNGDKLEEMARTLTSISKEGNFLIKQCDVTKEH